MTRSSRAFGWAMMLTACTGVAPARALPITYTYTQTAASAPGVFAGASLTIDGGFADLPVLTAFSPVLDFGKLLAFDFHTVNWFVFPTVTLADFGRATPFETFPRWRISPSGIVFIDASHTNEFHLSFAPLATVTLLTDFGEPAPCTSTPGCVSTGVWESVPEPSTAVLVALGLAACALRAHRRHASGRTLGAAALARNSADDHDASESNA